MTTDNHPDGADPEGRATGVNLTPVYVKGERAYNVEGDPGEILLGAPRGSITEREAEILAGLADGKDVLEIGTGTGFSSREMASRARSVTTIDVDPFVTATIFPILREMGIHCATEVPEGGEYDLVFIDGSHATEAVIRDYERTIGHVRRPGVVAFHDTHFASVGLALRKLGIVPHDYGTALGLASTQVE